MAKIIVQTTPTQLVRGQFQAPGMISYQLEGEWRKIPYIGRGPTLEDAERSRAALKKQSLRACLEAYRQVDRAH